MRKQCVFAILALGLFSSTLFAQGQPGAQANPPQQNRGPAPPVPGPPHDAHDLSGLWNMRRGYGGNSWGRPQPELTALGQQKNKEAKASNGGEYTLQQTNDPVITKCFPPGVPRIYLQPFPVQIVQTPAELIILYEYDHIVRHVFTDGRKHPEDLSPTYMGHSVGRWDGDTFVVDTVGFNDKSWLDRIGHPHSEDLHVIERFHRTDRDNLELDIAMEDPKILAKPWNAHLGFALHSDWSLMEQVCTDNDAFLNFEK